MDETQREALALRTIGFADVPCEAIVSTHAHALTRFTQNAIHQNLASDDTTVRVRIVEDGKTGVAETNIVTPAGLREAVARAREIASFAPVERAGTTLFANSRPATPAGAFDAATASAPPEARAEIVSAILEPIERSDLWAAGYATTSYTGVTIANSAGTLVSFDGTAAALNVKANGEDATGYAEVFANDVSALDGRHFGTVAANKALLGAKPRPVDPGAWTVILEPAAFGELLSYLIDHFSAQAVDEGSSFLCDGLDRAYAGEAFTLHDDFSHPLHAGMPFDYEGFPRERVALIERGSARTYVTDATWAARLDRPNTGHGLPAPSAEGPRPLHLVVAGGNKTVEQLVAETERGILVSRFWYIRPVDQRKTIVTGMTRDGTFLIEDGRLTAGVRNMRFNQSILAALQDSEFSSAAYRSGGYDYAIVTPAAKLKNFHFTSTTDF